MTNPPELSKILELVHPKRIYCILHRQRQVILKIASLALFRPKELVELVLSSELHREQLLCLPFTFGASHVDPFVLNSM